MVIMDASQAVSGPPTTALGFLEFLRWRSLFGLAGKENAGKDLFRTPGEGNFPLSASKARFVVDISVKLPPTNADTGP
jgi:hypothetical protein